MPNEEQIPPGSSALTGAMTGGAPSARSLRALDWLNFFLADVQSGLGPFLAVYLIIEHWDAASIGIVMTIAGIATLVAQTPAGAFIDGTHWKRAAIIAAAGLIAAAAFIVTLAPSFGVVAGAQVVMGAAGRQR